MTAAPGLGARAIDQILRRLRKMPAPRNGLKAAVHTLHHSATRLILPVTPISKRS